MNEQSAREFVQQERQHYDQRARTLSQADPEQVYRTFVEGYEREALRASYQSWVSHVSKLANRGPIKVLDYCAGQGHHAVTIQRALPEAEITAIDISGESLKVGERVADRLLAGRKPAFLEMDAHELKFEDGSFDLVSDFGSLSSLDFGRATREIHRVLKPGGCFMALETYGHNPITNLKRQLNVRRGKRTAWAAQHILNSDGLAHLRELFPSNETEHFGLATLGFALSPWRSSGLLSGLESLDRFFFRAPFLSRYAFKILFVGRKRPESN